MNLTLLSAARQRGISLIEGVLYLVIALAVIVGGIVFFQQAQLSNQVTDTARAGVGISSQARGLYQNQRTFGQGADLTAALLASGSVPSNFVNASDDGIAHPFGGGAVTVTGNNDGFAMTLTDLSEEACLRLATVGAGGTGPLGTGIEGMTFVAEDGGTAVDFTAEVDAANAAPVTAADAATSCGDDVDVTVFYNR